MGKWAYWQKKVLNNKDAMKQPVFLMLIFKKNKTTTLIVYLKDFCIALSLPVSHCNSLKMKEKKLQNVFYIFFFQTMCTFRRRKDASINKDISYH